MNSFSQTAEFLPQHPLRYILTKRFCREPRLLVVRKKRKDNPSSKDLDMFCMKHPI